MANRESTFKYKQNLSSKEFGFVLYHTFPKGVYSAPSINISNTGIIECTGGTFVFYDSTGTNKYGIKIDFNDDGLIGKTVVESDIGKYAFARFKYNSSGEGSVSIEIEDFELSNVSDAKENYIRLARIYKDGDVWKLDDSCMETASFRLEDWNDINGSRSYVCNPISLFEYNANANTRLRVYLKGDFVLGSINSHNPSLITENTNYGAIEPISKSNGYYVFLDVDGQIKVCKDNVPKQGKFVFAEKSPNQIKFNVYANPICINSPNISSLVADDKKYSDVNKSSLPIEIKSAKEIQEYAKNGYDKVNMDLIIEGLMKSVDGLINVCVNQQNEINKLKSQCRGLKVPDNTDPKGYTVFSKVHLNGDFTFEDNNSRLGSQSNPINELYVKDTLYTDSLTIN